MTSIDLEAHFYTRAVFDYLTRRKEYPRFVKENEPGAFSLQFTDDISLYQTEEFISVLCDLGEKRIREMDEAGLDIQVLSFSTPGIDELMPDYQTANSFAIELNDLVFETVQKNPSRFMGFATIAPYQPELGVKELERAINQLGFAGWLAHSNFGDGNYLDDRKYWPLLEAAESLNIPVYLHPTTPLTKEFGKYGFSLGGPPLGFQVDAALCLLRMIYAGVFDQFPKLTIILGHMGEMLPFLIPDRIDWAYASPSISTLEGFIKKRPAIKRTPAQVIMDNVYVTTSGRFSKPLLDYTLKVMGEDKLMLATDYPYENLKQSMDFIRGCGLPEALLEKICSGNARRLGIGNR
ncbi:5-carboxyvanillate decarboxylase [Legionella birminghamensis]|uniref:5-carboxyvanillate decarboxylase n=1 Tax=Legionella birminghamensis TaxID=28083 RepID=A0A378IEF3_9GAMM|nr:amidohydrolase family protein [Legionella birminghamensis]KTC66752.1 5-carboxyvanillate decarboxylase [Legionella birminghamensis]STX32901.1 5-carboxyvanillate decarboxylase [Legionella birminghamensis]